MSARAGRDALELACLIVSLALALPVVVAVPLDVLGLPLDPLHVLGATAATAAGIGVLWHWTRTARPWTGRWRVLGAAFLFVAVLLVGLSPGWPTLLTPSISVDAVHHYLLADYLYRHQALVHGQAEIDHLLEMVAYPFAPSLIAAIVARALSVPLVFLSHALPAVLAAAAAMFAYAVVQEITRKEPRPWFLPVVCASLFLLAANYTIGDFTRDYFVTQLFGMVMLLALWYWVLRYSAEPDRLAVAAIAVLAAALLFSYPFWIVSFLPSLVLTPRLVSPAVPIRRQIVDVGAIGLFVGLLGVPYFLEPGRLEIGQQILRQGGAALQPSWSVLPVPLVLLGAAGVLFCLAMRQHRPAVVWPISTLVMTALVYAAAGLTGQIDSYHADKLVYLLAHELPVFSTLAVFEGLRRLRSVHATAAVFALAIVTVGTWNGGRASIAPGAGEASPLRRRHLALVDWVKGNLAEPPSTYLTFGQSLSAYWLDVALLGRNRSDWHARRRLTDMADYWRWFADDSADRQLIVTRNLEQIDGPEVVVRYRAGDAGVIEHLPRAVTLPDRDLVVVNARVNRSVVAAGEVVDVVADVVAAGALERRYALAVELLAPNGQKVGGTVVPIVPGDTPRNLAPGERHQLRLGVRTSPSTIPDWYRVGLSLVTLPDVRPVETTIPVVAGGVWLTSP